MSFTGARRKETRTSTRTNKMRTELEAFVPGYEPATVHKNEMPIGILGVAGAGPFPPTLTKLRQVSRHACILVSASPQKRQRPREGRGALPFLVAGALTKSVGVNRTPSKSVSGFLPVDCVIGTQLDFSSAGSERMKAPRYFLQSQPLTGHLRWSCNGNEAATSQTAFFLFSRGATAPLQASNLGSPPLHFLACFSTLGVCSASSGPLDHLAGLLLSQRLGHGCHNRSDQ